MVHCERRVRLWWNWQTRYFEVVVGQPVQVQVLLGAPVFLPHRNFVHPKGVRATVSGNPGHDAIPYQEGEVRRRIEQAQT